MKLLTLLLSFIIFSFLSSNLIAHSQSGSFVVVPVTSCANVCSLASASQLATCQNQCSKSFTDKSGKTVAKVYCTVFPRGCDSNLLNAISK